LKQWNDEKTAIGNTAEVVLLGMDLSCDSLHYSLTYCWMCW